MRKNPIVSFAIAVAAVAMLYGCDNEEKMGGDILPDTDKSTLIVDTFEVKAYTVRENPVVSSNESYMLAGVVNDPIFGRSETSFACKFSNTSYGTYTEKDICDSVVLTLGMNNNLSRFLGDSLSAATIDVYRLIKPIDADVSYYSDFDISEYIDNTPIGSTEYVPAEADTMVKIKLDPSYGNLIIANTLSTTFDDNICGLYFKVSSGNCITKFYRSSSYTEYKVYHHIPSDTEEEVEPTSVVYTILSTDCSINMVAHDYAGTPVENQLNNPTDTDEYLYWQGLVGTKLRVEIPSIKKLAEIEDKYLMVSHAQLIAPLADTVVSGEDVYPAIENFICWGETDDGVNRYFSEHLLTIQSSTTFNKYTRDYKNHCYVLNCTARVDDMINTYRTGGTPDYGIYMVSNSEVTDLNRSVVCSPAHKDTPMILVVEYMLIDK